MGIMKCNRLNCENIGCERYSSVYGYICEECFRELVESSSLISCINEFMQFPKFTMSREEKEIVRNHLETIFPKN